MKKGLLICALLCSALIFSQNQEEQLAKDYFTRGDFEKALLSYKKLYEKQPGNSNFFLKVVETHQQLQRYEEAQALIENQVAKSRNPQFLVELGYNYQLKKEQEKADMYYQQAIQNIEVNSVYAFYVARRFEEHALIDHAAIVYEKAMELNPKANYHMQLARIYGEQGKVENMFSHYLSYIEKNPSYISYVKRSMSEYISEDSEDENNGLLRKALLKKIQTQPSVLWNQFLSWLYIQQRDYKKAFAQEKAIFKREQKTLVPILELAEITVEQGEIEVANSIFDYIIETAIHLETVVAAHTQKLELELEHSETKDLETIDQAYEALIQNFGLRPETVNLFVSYAHFIAFHRNDGDRAVALIKSALEKPLSRFNQARLKLKLGDILVFQEKFNEALIYFTQIQTSLKNSTISQEARFRVAKASYYKGDFKWAESQLKILKSSTSQLIANDALDLKLLISDNKYEDSTQTALRQYAKADLLAFQNKNKEAIAILEDVISKHKTESIVDQALFMLAQLHEAQKDYQKAETNYQRIIANYADDILIDDAYFRLAELYAGPLQQPEKAQPLYERVIFDHADSIYFVDARKAYRRLRGDEIN